VKKSRLKPKKVYTYDDLANFQDSNPYTSIGKMKVSSKPTAPAFGFGTASRQQQGKIFQSKELSKTQFLGKTSPGPNYEVRHTDKYYYTNDPTWTFGGEVRNTLNTGAKFAYYNRKDVDFDPVVADNTRRWTTGTAKIGLENRFMESTQKNKGTPGPEYNPGEKPEIPIAPLYSFGVRRAIPGFDPLAPNGSTPTIVGPGSYRKLDEKNTSIMPDHPHYSFTQEKKFRGLTNIATKNQTYDTRSAIGGQVSSKNKTLPIVSIGKAKKDTKPGIFKAHMATQPTQIRIQHPKF